jgi:hypothetical protein
VLPIGMWALAAGTAVTLYQRMRAVYADAKAKAKAEAAAEPEPGPPQSAEAWQSEEA